MLNIIDLCHSSLIKHLMMNCMCQRSLQLSSNYRAFSSSARRVASLGLGANDREIVADVVPAYPPGPTRWYKQSAKGLYGGQRVRFGNNTAEEYRTKTRRTWAVNVKTKRLYSNALKRNVQLRVTTRVMRTIDKLGGLDEYLLGEKDARIKELGEAGWWLRWAIMQTEPIKQRFRKEREALGLPTTPEIMSEKPIARSIEAAADDMDVNPVLESLEENKKDLRFRVSKFEYVKLGGKNWVPTASRRAGLIKMLKKLSPTASLKQWENIEHKRSLEGKAPYPEKLRLTWFKLRERDYRQVLSQYKRVDPAEEMTEEDIERQRSMDSANQYLLEYSLKDQRVDLTTAPTSQVPSVVGITSALEKL